MIVALANSRAGYITADFRPTRKICLQTGGGPYISERRIIGPRRKITGAGRQGVVRGARGAIPGFQSPSTPHKRETNSLIAFCEDARGPRATSGQGRAYSAARDDIPDRTALSANNWPGRCTISKPRRRDLTLHSKIAGPSKCSYRLKCSRRSWFHIPLVVSSACGAYKHYTSNNRLAEIRFPCAKSLSIDLRQMSRFMQPAPRTLALHSTRIRSTRVRFGCAAMLLSMRPFNLEIPVRNSEQIVIECVARVRRAYETRTRLAR